MQLRYKRNSTKIESELSKILHPASNKPSLSRVGSRDALHLREEGNFEHMGEQGDKLTTEAATSCMTEHGERPCEVLKLD